MNKIKDFINKNKKLSIFIIVFLGLIIILSIVSKIMNILSNSNEPIVAITATNDKTYEITDEISVDDFNITAEHSDGKKTGISSEYIELSGMTVDNVGETTAIELIYTEDRNVKCTVEVNVRREKLVGFQCGYPDISGVTAILYSNGELCFEGEGDVLVCNEGEYPWLDYEGIEDMPIKSVTFQKDVKPTNMNYWFEGVETLEYVGSIPTSVRTMVSTFNGCTALVNGADWSNAENLLNINYCYANCTSLEKVGDIPANVRVAKSAFEECNVLQMNYDLTSATNLSNATNMFFDCYDLTAVTLSPSLRNMTGMFQNCINLKVMPEIPETVRSMESAFSGCVSLTKATTIPEGVTSLINVFYDCELLAGDVVINTDTADYEGALVEAVAATKINLLGSSPYLNEMALEADNDNIYVNGYKPIPVEED